MPNPPTQPQHAAAHASAAAQLERYFRDGEDLLKSDVRSPQSSFEATMGQLEKSRRHRIYRKGFGDGSLTLAGSDIACGCEVHPTGEAGGGSYELDADGLEASGRTVAYFRRIKVGIAEARWKEDGWAPAETVERILRARFHKPMTGALAMFDARASRRVLDAIGYRDSKKALDRERYRLMADVLKKQQELGLGNLAPYTATARAAHAGVRTPRTVTDWIDALGRKLMRSQVSPTDRALANAITAEAEGLEELAVAAYRRAMGGHVPEAVKRAGLAG